MQIESKISDEFAFSSVQDRPNFSPLLPRSSVETVFFGEHRHTSAAAGPPLSTHHKDSQELGGALNPLLFVISRIGGTWLLRSHLDPVSRPANPLGPPCVSLGFRPKAYWTLPPRSPQKALPHQHGEHQRRWLTHHSSRVQDVIETRHHSKLCHRGFTSLQGRPERATCALLMNDWSERTDKGEVNTATTTVVFLATCQTSFRCAENLPTSSGSGEGTSTHLLANTSARSLPRAKPTTVDDVVQPMVRLDRLNGDRPCTTSPPRMFAGPSISPQTT